MNKEYKKAPDVLTTKDLDYLKDIFGWNHTAYKVSMDALEFINDKQVANMFMEASKIFYDHMKTVISILKEESNNE